MRIKRLLLLCFWVGIFSHSFSQHRPIDMFQKEDRLGFTGMFKYSINDWNTSKRATRGELNFDSFRAWAQTDINNVVFASVQYRFYYGWQTPQYLNIGFHIKNTTLKVGQIWVPFGFEWQPLDDWGNIAFYTGFQDDYDYGATWKIPVEKFTLTLGLFKNQQLSSDSRWRYDADIFSGGINDADDLILIQKKNEEVNQFNVDLNYAYDNNDFSGEFGVSAMAGQIYNIDVDELGSRLAIAGYYSLNKGRFHASLQGIWYDFKQELPQGTPASEYNFINMSCWNVSYEMPSKASIFSSTMGYSFFEKKLNFHVNYSMLTGGTTVENSQLFTSGVNSFFGPVELFAEVYYGISDPQLSGRASGYGRDSSVRDFRFDLRVYYKLSLVKTKDIKFP